MRAAAIILIAAFAGSSPAALGAEALSAKAAQTAKPPATTTKKPAPKPATRKPRSAEAAPARHRAGGVQLPDDPRPGRAHGRDVLRRADRPGSGWRRRHSVSAASGSGDAVLRSAQPPHVLGRADQDEPRLSPLYGHDRRARARQHTALEVLRPERVPHRGGPRGSDHGRQRPWRAEGRGPDRLRADRVRRR